MSDPTADVTKATGLLSNLEKANDVQTFLLLFSFILVVDCGLLRSQGFGILALTKDEHLLNPRFAVSVAIIFVVFSLLMSIARPFVARLVMHITSVIVDWCRVFGLHIRRAIFEYDSKEEDRQITREYRSKLGSGLVTISRLRAKADETRDSYYRDMLKKEEEKKIAQSQQEENLAFSIVATIVFATYNWFAFGSQPAESFLKGVAVYLGENGGLFLLVFFIALYWIGVVAPLQQPILRWTYCPSLAKEEAAEFDQRQVDDRRFLKDTDFRPDEGSPPPKPFSR